MLLKLFIKSIKEENFRFACLRMLKVLSIRINRFIRNIPCVLMSFKEEKVVRKINNYKMNLYLSDKGIARELFSYGKREHFTTDLVQEGNIIKTGDVILDLGANIGYCALMEAKMVGPTGKIYAVEPSPINFNRLKENITLNRYTNIEIDFVVYSF